LVQWPSAKKLDVFFHATGLLQNASTIEVIEICSKVEDCFCVMDGIGGDDRHNLDIGQAIAKAAKQMVFIIEESKFVGQLKDAVPVLIEQVPLSPCNCP
jgi:hypothetical protein